jgi:hypothetical protein
MHTDRCDNTIIIFIIIIIVIWDYLRLCRVLLSSQNTGF